MQLRRLLTKWLTFPAAVAIAFIMASTSAAPAGPAPAPAGIRVVVSGLRNDDGRVGCSLFKGPDGFPRHKDREFRGMWAPIHNRIAVCDFTAVPAGVYGAVILHDENRDGKMDFNIFHIPTKGYGFSNDAPATLSPPSFSAASFTYGGKGNLTIPITTVYRASLR